MWISDVMFTCNNKNNPIRGQVIFCKKRRFFLATLFNEAEVSGILGSS